MDLAEGKDPVKFPETPWALPLTMNDFPYPREYHAQWFWRERLRQGPAQRCRGDSRLEPAGGVRGLQCDEERRRSGQAPDSLHDLAGLHRRARANRGGSTAM